MMNQISRKIGNVADFPLKLNLQLFADDEGAIPELENTPEFKEDVKEFSQFEAKMAKFTEERKAKETPVIEKVVEITENEPVKAAEEAGNKEVATPSDKPKQDMETNKAFQEMRQKLEASEKAKTENEAKAKKADDVIAKEYGKSHGIFTVEQYEQRLQQEQEAADNQRYTDAGLTPQEVEKIREYDRIKAEAESIKTATTQQMYLSQWDSLYKAYPDIVESSKSFNDGKDPEWYNDDMKAEIARGASPIAAYRHAHFETILANATKGTRETAKQEALNQLNSKDHIKANAIGGGEVEHVQIPEAMMVQFRALNKGKTDAQIRSFYKKQTAGG